MTGRVETMRYHNLHTCPDWCTQPDDEDQWEHHVSEWAELDGESSGYVLRVRARASWWDDYPDEDRVEVEIAGAGGAPGSSSSSDAHGAAWLGLGDVDTLADMFAEARDMVDGWRSGTSEWQWAFDGAEDLAARNEAA
jgi:hypothetical protein